MNTNDNNSVIFPGINDGDTFEVAGIEFIKFPSRNGMTPVVSKDILFRSSFGEDNDFRKSKILKTLESEYLPRIIEAVGDENICTIKTDLTTLDGLKKYGVMESLVSLPTLDFYRANAEIFDKYNPCSWWWLATADSAKPHYDPIWSLCVSPSGAICYVDFNVDYYGVRPFYIFKSSIFGSSEE